MQLNTTGSNPKINQFKMRYAESLFKIFVYLFFGVNKVI